MNKLLISISLLTLPFTKIFGQHSFDPTNAREGETVEYCHQHKHLNELKTSNPVAYQQIMNDQKRLEKFTQEHVEAKSGTIYTIPIVFHVLHQNGTENISDEQIFDAVEVLNRDYRRLNADANNVHPDFLGLPADAKIEFKLATIAPNGQCFNGITRTVSSLTFDGTSGNNQLDAVFAGNDVYQGIWPHFKYLNILVADHVNGAAGYTMYPNDGIFGNPVYSNTIFVNQTYVGRIGTGTEVRSRTLTHEVGHWLNLAHTWGNSNSPDLEENCDTDDGVMDTPNTRGVRSCNLNEDFCGPRANVENYMDYSYCSKMFTPGQVARMRAAIVSPVGRRNELWTASNLASVGAIANPPLCKAEFTSNKTIICVGESIDFTDKSFNTVSGWSWTFEGGTPATSNIANPTVTYNTPGVYQVTLTSSHASINKTVTKTAYIKVLEPIRTLPYFEGFENYTTLENAQGYWSKTNPNNGKSFEVTTLAARTGQKSVHFDNFNETTEDKDELISPTFDLSNESLNDVTLSFRYAYRKKNTTTNETLRLFFSRNCGNVWQFRRSFSSNVMSDNIVVGTNWIPTQNDWKTVHIPFNTVAYTQYLADGFRFKFVFENDKGNNLFIDDINLYNGPASDEIVLSINNHEVINSLSIFPNPNDGELNITFSAMENQTVALKILDITGKELKKSIFNANIGENIIILDNSDLSTGMYLIQINAGNTNKTLQFVKK